MGLDEISCYDPGRNYWTLRKVVEKRQIGRHPKVRRVVTVKETPPDRRPMTSLKRLSSIDSKNSVGGYLRRLVSEIQFLKLSGRWDAVQSC